MILTLDQVITLKQQAEINHERNKDVLNLIDTISYIVEVYQNKEYKSF